MINYASSYKNEVSTIIYVAINSKETGFIDLSDTLRNDSKQVIRNLKEINIESVLLTGDNPQAASNIAKQVGIINAKSKCLPEDTLYVIEQYHNKNKMFCMVGDGINNAPALKKAHVGIAMWSW